MAPECLRRTQQHRCITNQKQVALLSQRPRDASCLSVVSFNSTKRRVESFIVSYVGYRFVKCGLTTEQRS